jgi:asparagine synthetase B (glutamine-hydrolysing)
MGGDCVKRFIGMWAFTIRDKTKKELFCSRDRFGIKPFYYIHAGSKFYLGSEYKPLKLSPLSIIHLTIVKLAADYCETWRRTWMRRILSA